MTQALPYVLIIVAIILAQGITVFYVLLWYRRVLEEMRREEQLEAYRRQCEVVE